MACLDSESRTRSMINGSRWQNQNANVSFSLAESSSTMPGLARREAIGRAERREASPRDASPRGSVGGGRIVKEIYICGTIESNR
eukprot:1900386-Pyramimonas_sp.AAC.1